MGAAVMNVNGGKVIMTGCTISGVTTQQGGAIYNGGKNSTIELTNCTLTGNKAKTYGSGKCKGGAIINDNGTVKLTGCTLRDNAATPGDNGRSDGGAIYGSGAFGRILLTDCTLTGNSAMYGGAVRSADGCFIVMERCLLASNTSTQLGGAIYHDADQKGKDQTMILDSCSLIGNRGLTVPLTKTVTSRRFP